MNKWSWISDDLWPGAREWHQQLPKGTRNEVEENIRHLMLLVVLCYRDWHYYFSFTIMLMSASKVHMEFPPGFPWHNFALYPMLKAPLDLLRGWEGRRRPWSFLLLKEPGGSGGTLNREGKGAWLKHWWDAQGIKVLLQLGSGRKGQRVLQKS